VLPARDSVTNTLLLHPWHYCMIAVGFTAPATLYKLKWKWNVLYVVGMLENQRSTLKEGGSIHTLIPSRKGEDSQYPLFVVSTVTQIRLPNLDTVFSPP
jgi:hypothetical protein